MCLRNFFIVSGKSFPDRGLFLCRPFLQPCQRNQRIFYMAFYTGKMGTLRTEWSGYDRRQLAGLFYFLCRFSAKHGTAHVFQMPPGLMVFGADCFDFGYGFVIILDILRESIPHVFQIGSDFEEPDHVIQRRNAVFLKSGNGVFTAVYDVLL